MACNHSSLGVPCTKKANRPASVISVFSAQAQFKIFCVFPISEGPDKPEGSEGRDRKARNFPLAYTPLLMRLGGTEGGAAGI